MITSFKPLLAQRSRAARPWTRRTGRDIARILAFLGVTLVGSGAAAGDLPEKTSLIEFGSRVFDMRADAGRIPRDDHFIPIDRVAWIDEVMERDPDLDPTVIHIDSAVSERGRRVWQLDQFDLRHPHTEGLPDVMMLDGYKVRWHGKIRAGLIILAPLARDDYFVNCFHDAGDPAPGFCSVTVSYPADRDIRIRVRVYRFPHQPINDFAAIATKALLLVHCILDVTEAVEEGTWRPRPYLTPEDALPEIAECRQITS